MSQITNTQHLLSATGSTLINLNARKERFLRHASPQTLARMYRNKKETYQNELSFQVEKIFFYTTLVLTAIHDIYSSAFFFSSRPRYKRKKKYFVVHSFDPLHITPKVKTFLTGVCLGKTTPEDLRQIRLPCFLSYRN